MNMINTCSYKLQTINHNKMEMSTYKISISNILNNIIILIFLYIMSSSTEKTIVKTDIVLVV